MADGERRMLFDTRGKRKHVIRVVYAVLALLMGASLFLVVGPFNLAELTGGSSGSSASEVFEEQAERIEEQLAKDPQDEGLLLALTRAHINAGNAQLEPVAEGEVEPISADARKEFDAAAEAWGRYLKLAGDEPNATAAQLVAGTFFRLAEAASTNFGGLGEVHENVALAVRAQRIAAEQEPNLGSLSALAIYEYFNGDFAAGDKAMKQAAAEAPAKAEAKSVEKQLAVYRKNAKRFQKSAKRAAKLEQRSGSGQEALQDPFGFGGAPPGG
jgi:hypothetical protein